MPTSRNRHLRANLSRLYKKKRQQLPYHGWHHITFVTNKATEFAKAVGLSKNSAELIEAAALTHDLNYLVRSGTEPDTGVELRKRHLSKVTFDEEEIEKIERMIAEAHMSVRHANISQEAQILSDADTLFKVVPISHLIFTPYYFAENGTDIKRLASKIVREQIPLLKKGIYFYNPAISKRYKKWAEVNLALWQEIDQAMNDRDVRQLAEMAKKLQVL